MLNKCRTDHGLPRWRSGKESTRQCRRCRKTRVWSLGREDSLKEKMAAHSSILAWKIPWTEEPGRLQSVGLHRVRQLSTHTDLLSALFLSMGPYASRVTSLNLRFLRWKTQTTSALGEHSWVCSEYPNHWADVSYSSTLFLGFRFFFIWLYNFFFL